MTTGKGVWFMRLLVGDLIFVRSTELLGLAIEWAENGVYSHVAIYAGDGQVLEAEGGRTIGYRALKDYDGKYDIGHVQAVNCTPTPKRVKVLKEAERFIGKKYDWKLDVLLAIKLLFHVTLSYEEKNKFICSTYAARVWKAAGLPLSNILYPTPQDLANSPLITIEKI